MELHSNSYVWKKKKKSMMLYDEGRMQKLLRREDFFGDGDLVVPFFLAPSCFLETRGGTTHEAVQCHRKFHHPEGDHFTLINIYNAYKQSQREQCKT